MNFTPPDAQQIIEALDDITQVCQIYNFYIFFIFVLFCFVVTERHANSDHKQTR